MTSVEKRPLRCRLNLHSWYEDCSIGYSARRCNYCPAVEDEVKARALDESRARIAALPPGATPGQIYAAALHGDEGRR